MHSNPQDIFLGNLQPKALAECSPSQTTGPWGIEYAITNTFLKKVSASLLGKELEIISKSNDLIEQLQVSKQLESTVDQTLNRSFISSNSMSDCLNKSSVLQRKLISRKSPKALPADLHIQRCLRDIEDNCSPATCSAIRGMIEDMKKMRRTIIQLQASEKLNTGKKNQTQRLQQENYIMKGQIQELKQKLKKLNTETKEPAQPKLHLKNNQEDKKINQMKAFLSERENFMVKKVDEGMLICKRIEAVLDRDQVHDSCSKCCSFLKRIKESLLNYREYLKGQEQQLDTLYQQYKQNLISCS